LNRKPDPCTIKAAVSIVVVAILDLRAEAKVTMTLFNLQGVEAVQVSSAGDLRYQL
jgi:hypothetical protein